jgi:hypothetical protein
MADKTVQVWAADGSSVPVKYHDNGDGTYSAADYQSGGAISVSSYIAIASATFTRPSDTTAYAQGDLVANTTVANTVTPMQFTVARVAAGSGSIRRMRLRKSGTGVTSAQFRLHLYTASPTQTGAGGAGTGDNAVWSTDGVANYLGAFDVSVDRQFTDGAAGNGIPVNGNEINFALSSGQIIYGLLEYRGPTSPTPYTPVSGEVFTVALEVYQN